MKFDLAFVLIDLDEPRYKAAACEMIRSARRAYKDHDMRVVQLTDNRSAHCPDADGVFGLDTDVKGNQFCQAKGHLMAEYALKADRPVIFCDVDLLWQSDALAGGIDFEGVWLMKRDELPCMPYNTGVVRTTPDAKPFWSYYRQVLETLPPEVCGWWGDQFAMLAAAHWDRDMIYVRHMPMDKTAPCIESVPGEPLKTPAVHFKGDAKRLMPAYARLLDEGKVFDFVRPNVTAEACLDALESHIASAAESVREIGVTLDGARQKAAVSRQGWAF